ncbi:unnamed protein product [Blepharisma stoltei]|uniref:Uncharacterized protein n=1 Tax=Blepharisma stoltei TaxID=1481888 RepID=A0AAU9KSN6_9CILI|nr:unnamed protein product [Blepharisma stoltei]
MKHSTWIIKIPIAIYHTSFCILFLVTIINMTTSFFPLIFDSINVGRHIKGTKKRLTWKFELDGKEQTIIMFISKFSGKRKILLNGDIKIETRKASSYATYPLRVGRHCIILYEQEDGIFDLRCDNLSFDMIMRKNRYNSSFGEAQEYNLPKVDPFEQECFSPKNMANDYEEHLGRYDPYIPKENGQKNIWNTNIVGFRRSEAQREGFSTEKIEFQTAIHVNSMQTNKDTQNVAKPKESSLDILSAPYTVSSLPTDLFTKPLSESHPQSFTMNTNPFESGTAYPYIDNTPKFSEPPKEDLSSIVDLDNLSKGDNYSPAEVRKYYETHKAFSLPDTPNVPIYQLRTSQTQAPAIPNTEPQKMYYPYLMMNPYTQYHH